MRDPAFESVLRLVAEGRLTADEAAPLLDALDAASTRGPSTDETGPGSGSTHGATPDPIGDRPGRALRIEVRDAGRTVINLRIPLSLGRAAIDQIPGISEVTSQRIREAIAAGIRGSILDVDDEGDGVRVSIE